LARVVTLRAFSAGALGGGLLAVAVTLASLGQGCSVAGLSSSGAEGDGSPGGDDGGSSSGGGSGDATACQPGDVRTFAPQAYTGASPPWQDACSAEQLQQAFRDCFDPKTLTPAACTAFRDPDGGTGVCAACLIVPVSATTFGPFIDHGAYVAENASGCLELTDPGPGGLTCAKAQQALDGCELAACAAFCPAYDIASRLGLDECMKAAAAGGCQMFAQQASCAASAVEAGRAAQCTGLLLQDFFLAVAPLFCGAPPAPDGSAPPSDASGTSNDAGNGGDAGGPADAGGGHDAGGDASTDAPSSDALLPEGAPRDGTASDGPSGSDARADAAAD
jgi:hypothetical protein